MKNHLIKRKLNSKVIATILGIALLVNLLSVSTIYAEGISGQFEDNLVIPTGDYYINQDNHNYQLPENYSGVILISKNVNNVKVTGFSKKITHKNTAIDIEQRNEAIELTIENLNISAPAGSDGINFSNSGNYDNKLYISGTNEMLVLNEGAGIHIPEKVKLTIDKAQGIVEDVDGELTIQGGDYAAGIGGGKGETGGDIIIDGSKINVGKKTEPEHYGVYEYSTGAGIGGGYNGDGGNIIINGGIITTYGGRRHETNNYIPSSAVGAGLRGGYKGSGGNNSYI